MTAKIKIEIDDQTKVGASTIGQELKKLDTAAGKAGKSIEDLTQEMDSRKQAEYRKEVQRLADELDGTAKKAREAEAAIKKQNAAVDDAARYANSATRAMVKQNEELRELDRVATVAAAKAGKLTDYQRDLQAALEERKVRAYRQEIDKLADSMSGINKASAKAAPSIGMMWTEMASKLTLAGQAARALWGGISFLAEKGVPAFQRLQRVVADLGDTMAESFKADGFVVFSRSVEQASNTILKRFLRNSIGVANNAAEAMTVAFDLSNNLVGIDAQGERRQAWQREIEKREGLAAGKKWQEEKNRELAVAEIDDNILKRRAEHIDELRILEMRSIKSVNDEIAKERVKLELAQQKYIKDGLEKTKAAAQEAADKITRMENLRHDLVKQHEEEEWQDKLNKIDAEWKRKAALRAWEQQMDRAALDHELKLGQLKAAMQDRENAAQQERIDKLRAFMEAQGHAMGGGGNQPPQMPIAPAGMQGGQQGGGWGPPPGQQLPGQQPGNPLDVIKGKATPQRIQQQIIENRQKAAVDEWREKMRAAGRMDQNGNLIPEEVSRRALTEGPIRADVRLGWNDDDNTQIAGGATTRLVAMDGRGNPVVEERVVPALGRGPVQRVTGRNRFEPQFRPGDRNVGGPIPGMQDRKLQERRTKAKERELARQARMKAFRTARQGKLPQAEVERARGDVMGKAVDAAADSGKLSQDVVGALRQSVNTMQRLSEENARLQDEVRQAQKELDELERDIEARLRAQGERRTNQGAALSQGSR